MGGVAIRTERLGKRYQIGSEQPKYYTLREALVDGARKSLAWLHGSGSGRRNTVWALKDVSLEIEEGEIFGVIGRNGAGKSTLLKVLSRITEPTEGQAEIRGRVGSLLEVGTGFHPELTGRENIYLSGAIMGMRRAEIRRKFDEIVDFAGIHKFIDTPAKRYSSGMYVRLAFAVAAHLDAEILLVDEVLAVGDVEFQKRCLGRMGTIARSGRTVLLVSHQMNLVNRLCTRAALLDGGRIVEIGPTSNVIERYLSGESGRSVRGPVDLRHLPRPAHVTGRIKLVGAEFRTPQPIEYGEPLELLVSFQVVSHVDYAELSLIVGTLDGFNFLSSMASGDWGGPLLVEPQVGRTYSARVQVPECRWVPQTYSLTLGARSGPGGAEDFVGIGTFEIVPSTRDPGCFEGRWDTYRPRADWQYVDA